MADESRDVLMKIVLGGAAIPAECSAGIAPGDPLAGGFTSASANNDWKSNFFSVQDFQIEVGLMGDASASTPQNATSQLNAMNAAMQEQMKQLWEAQKSSADGKPLTAGSSGSEYSRFMGSGRSALRGKSYSANLEPVSLTKSLDASSLTLFKACINSTTLDSAVMIKRRGGGGDHLRTYLRVEFTDLLITDFNWDEEDVVKEKIKFVCRKAQAQYSVENNDGTLQKPAQPRSWSVLNLP